LADTTIRNLNLFAGPEHRLFKLEGGTSAALVIHGFLGTPAEMRPLATHLHLKGWTVEGLLLPGFGNQLDTLFDQTYRGWIDAASSSLLKLQEKYHPVLIIGYSMGAAIALNVALTHPPDALVLLAPFWQLGNTLHYIIWQVVRRIFPNPRPFGIVNISDARIGELIVSLLPELDLDDPQVQEAVREMRVPARFVEQIFAVGRSAGKAAPNVRRPTLIIQGTQDQAIKQGSSRQLLNRLPGPVTYQELETNHGLVEADNPGFDKMARSVLAFAGEIVDSARSNSG